MKYLARSIRLILPLALVFLTGCTEETVEGSKLTVKFATWVPIAVILGGIAAGVGGFFLKRYNTKYGWTLLVLGPVMAVIVGPGMLKDHLIVDDDHFELETGFWFMPTKHSIRFDEIRSIEIKEEPNGKSTKVTMYCRKNNNEMVAVPVGDLMKQGALDRIVQRAKSKGFR